MSENEEKPAGGKPGKKRMMSIPFLVLGVILLACVCPVGDIDGDGSMDVAGKWVMLKVMTSQENSKVGGPTAPDEFNNNQPPKPGGM